MFATIEEKAIVGVLALIAVVGSVMWLEHQGAKRCEAGDATVAADAKVHNAEVKAAGHVADAALESDREKAADAPVAPAAHVSVQPAPQPPRSCPAARPRPAAAASPPQADVRDPGAAGIVQPYLSPQWVAAINDHLDADVRRGVDADIEVTYLQGLLIERDRVCRGQMPP